LICSNACHERNDRKERGSARVRLNLQFATELLQTRAHSKNPDSETLRLAGGGRLGNACPVVADTEDQAPGALPENQADLGRHGVPLDVRHRLLHDPQQRSLEIERKVVDCARDLDDGFEAGAPAKAIYELSDGRTQSLALKIGRMEEIGEGSELPQAFVQR
jgi:hypothetical protein